MPNDNTPFGLRPIRNKAGAPYTGAANPYYIPASYATALFIGDPVIKTGTSNTANVSAPGVGQFAPGTMAEINKATAGTTNRVTGVIVGFAAVPSNLGLTYNPASTERIALVCDDPDVSFEAQADTCAATAVGLNANFTFAAGSTITGRSGTTIDGTNAATTVGFQTTIMRIVNRDDNETGAFAKIEVKLNNHTEVNASTGI